MYGVVQIAVTVCGITSTVTAVMIQLLREGEKTRVSITQLGAIMALFTLVATTALFVIDQNTSDIVAIAIWAIATALWTFVAVSEARAYTRKRVNELADSIVSRYAMSATATDEQVWRELMMRDPELFKSDAVRKMAGYPESMKEEKEIDS